MKGALRAIDVQVVPGDFNEKLPEIIAISSKRKVKVNRGGACFFWTSMDTPKLRTFAECETF